MCLRHKYNSRPIGSPHFVFSHKFCLLCILSVIVYIHLHMFEVIRYRERNNDVVKNYCKKLFILGAGQHKETEKEEKRENEEKTTVKSEWARTGAP